MPVEPLRADGLGLIFAIVMGIAFINLVRASKQAAEKERQRRLEEAQQARRRGGLTASAGPAARPAGGGRGLLEDLQRNLELLTGTPATTVPARRQPGGRPPEVLDLDLEAEDVAQRRIEEAEARNRALSDADHAAFEARIRQSEVKASAPAPAGGLRLPDLHRAVIWHELLSPPVGLRGSSGPEGLLP